MLNEKEVEKVCKKFGIKLVFTKEIDRATADITKGIIKLHPKKATNYDAMHEIGHIICGWGCCREHCEWEAHGAGKMLCKLYGFSIGHSENRMTCYAHRSNPKACGRYSQSKGGGK